MADKIKDTTIDKKEKTKDVKPIKKVETKKEVKTEEAKKKVEVKREIKTEEIKKKVETKREVETGKIEKKIKTQIDETEIKNRASKDKKTLPVKDKAIVNAYSLRISPKHSKYICRMIAGKSLDRAMEMLQQVIDGKLAVRMTQLEVPHQKGKGVSGGKYPVNSARQILLLLKQLEANSIVNGIEKPVIKIAKPNKASEPSKRKGRRGKRTHIYLESVSKDVFLKNKKERKK